MKLYKLIVAMFLFATVSIFSQNEAGRVPASCSTCCCSPCDCQPCDFVPPCPPDTCAYNAPHIIDLRCGWDLFVTGSFVYFQAKEENLEFGETRITFADTQDSLTTTNIEYQYSSVCFDYKPAFKVGMGINFGCDDWAFYTEYFRYHADAGSGSLSAEAPSLEPSTGQLFITSYLFNNIPYLGSARSEEDAAISYSAKSKWRIEMDVVDFLLSRRYYVGQCLTLKTYGGLRAAWIDQTYKVQYNALFPQFTTETVDSESNATLSSCSWAVGAKAGLHTDWNFCGGFYFFTDSSFDLLYTDYKIKEDRNAHIIRALEDGTILAEFVVTVDGKRSKDLCFLRPHCQIGLGLGWGDYFCCNDYYVDLKVGYEFNVYWNQNVLPMIPDQDQDPSRLYGDLSLHGLAITLRLDF